MTYLLVKNNFNNRLKELESEKNNANLSYV